MDAEDFEFMNKTQLREAIADLEEEIEQDESLRNTREFSMVSDRLAENQELLESAQAALRELG